MKAIICTAIVAAAICFSAWIYTQALPGRWKTSIQGNLVTKTDTITGELWMIVPADQPINTTGRACWMKVPPDVAVATAPAPQQFVPPPVSSIQPPATNAFTLIPTAPATANQTRRAIKAGP